MTYSDLYPILDVLPFGVALIDPSQHVLYTNTTLSQLLGHATPEWVGQPWASCLAAVGAVADTTTLRIGERVLRRQSLSLADGTRLELIESHPHDILRELFIVWDEAAAFHAHELRNPLTAMLGYSTLLRDRPMATDEKRREWAARSVEKAQAMRDAIKHFAESSRFLADRYRFQRVGLDLARLAETVAQQVTQTTGRRILLLSVPCWVNGDPARLSQLMHSVINYIVAHTAVTDTLTVQVAATGTQATMSIGAEGMVVSAEAEATFFDPQLSLNGAPEAGMGLAIARGIAAAHGGTLQLNNLPQQGTLFTLTLPQVPDPNAPME